MQALEGQDFDVVVTDLNMRGVGGLQLCEHVVANRPDLPVVVLTGFGSLESAVAAIRAGAYDFINKPVELDVLAIAAERAAAHRRLREEVKRLRVEAGQAPRFDALVGRSPAMQIVYDLVDRGIPHSGYRSQATLPDARPAGSGRGQAPGLIQ